jgi:hypothetical protein
MDQFWRFQNADHTGDYAPFPSNDPAHNMHPGNSFAFGEAQQLPRAPAYGPLPTVPSSESPFAMPPQQQQPSLRYAPTTLDMRGAPLVANNTGPHSAPPLPVHQAHHYMMSHPHNSAGTASMSPHQGYGSNWYPETSSFGTLEEEQESYASRQRGPS